MSTVITHSHQPAALLQLAQDCLHPFSYSWDPRKVPEPASWGTETSPGEASCTVMRIGGDKGRDRRHCTPDDIFKATVKCWHQEVKLPGGTRLWHFSSPTDQRKPIPVTKLRVGQENHRTLCNLALPIHLFTQKCWCKSRMSRALGMQKWTNRNK